MKQSRSLASRIKGMAVALPVAVIFSFVIVGGYVVGFDNAFEHLGSACRLGRNLTHNLKEAFAIFGTVVAVLFIVAFMIEGWKRRGVPEVLSQRR